MVDFVHFGSQIVAIFIEERVIDMGRRLGIKESAWTRTLGYVWTFLSMAYTLRPWMDMQVSKGAFVKPPFPVSPISMALEWSGVAL